jgi:hypothetical protein
LTGPEIAIGKKKKIVAEKLPLSNVIYVMSGFLMKSNTVTAALFCIQQKPFSAKTAHEEMESYVNIHEYAKF